MQATKTRPGLEGVETLTHEPRYVFAASFNDSTVFVMNSVVLDDSDTFTLAPLLARLERHGYELESSHKRESNIYLEGRALVRRFTKTNE